MDKKIYIFFTKVDNVRHDLYIPYVSKESRPNNLYLRSYEAAFSEKVQKNFNGSNTDGSFTTAISNSFLSP